MVAKKILLAWCLQLFCFEINSSSFVHSVQSTFLKCTFGGGSFFDIRSSENKKINYLLHFLLSNINYPVYLYNKYFLNQFFKNNLSQKSFLENFQSFFYTEEHFLRQSNIIQTAFYPQKIIIDDLKTSYVLGQIQKNKPIVFSIKSSLTSHFLEKLFFKKCLSPDEFFKILIKNKDFLDPSVLKHSDKDIIDTYFVSLVKNYISFFAPDVDKNDFENVFLDIARVYSEFDRSQEHSDLRKNILCIYDVLCLKKVFSFEEMIHAYQLLQRKFSFKDLLNDFTYFIFHNYLLLEGDKVVIVEPFQDRFKEVRKNFPWYEEHDRVSFYEQVLMLWKKAFGSEWKSNADKYYNFSEINLLRQLLDETQYERKYSEPLYIIGRKLSLLFKAVVESVELSAIKSLKIDRSENIVDEFEQKKEYINKLISFFDVSSETLASARALSSVFSYKHANFLEAILDMKEKKFDSAFEGLSLIELLNDSIHFCDTCPSNEIIIKYRKYYDNNLFLKFCVEFINKIHQDLEEKFEKITNQEIKKLHEDIVNQEFLTNITYRNLFEKCRELASSDTCLMKHEGKWLCGFEPINLLDLCNADRYLVNNVINNEKKNLLMKYKKCLNDIFLIKKKMKESSFLYNYFVRAAQSNCLVESLFFMNNVIYQPSLDVSLALREKVYKYCKHKYNLPLNFIKDVENVYKIAFFLYKDNPSIIKLYKFLKNCDFRSLVDAPIIDSSFFKSLKNSLEHIAYFSSDMGKKINYAATKYLDHTLLDAYAKKSFIDKAVLMCNIYKNYLPDKYISSEDSLLLIWSDFIEMIMLLEQTIGKENITKNIVYASLFNLNQNKKTNNFHSIIGKFQFMIKDKKKLILKCHQFIHGLCLRHCYIAKKYGAFFREDWESINTLQEFDQLQKNFFKTLMYAVFHFHFHEKFSLQDLFYNMSVDYKKDNYAPSYYYDNFSRNKYFSWHLFSKKLLFFMREIYDEYKKYNVKHPLYFEHAKVFEVCLMGNILNRLTYEYIRALQETRTIHFKNPHSYLKYYIEITCFFPFCDPRVDPLILISYIRHNSKIFFPDHTSYETEYICALEKEYKKKVFNLLMNKKNQLENSFEKIFTEAFSLYHTITNYLQKKPEKILSKLHLEEFEKKFFTNINMIDAISKAVFENEERMYCNDDDGLIAFLDKDICKKNYYNNIKDQQVLYSLIQIFDQEINKFDYRGIVDFNFIEKYLQKIYEKPMLYPSLPSAVQAINLFNLETNSSRSIMNFFHTRHSLDQGVQQISRRKTIYYGKKYLEKYKKKCADILKNKNYVTKKSIKAGFEKILTNVLQYSENFMKISNKNLHKKFSEVYFFQRFMQKNSGINRMLYFLCKKGYLEKVSLWHKNRLIKSMIPIKISYNDQALPSPMYYFLYPKALESYVDNGGVPPEIGHFLINAFFSYYGIQTPSKNAFLKIIQESEKLYRRMLPVKHFQEKIEQELKKTIV